MMKNEKFMGSFFGRILGSGTSPDESNSYEDHKKFFKIRNELNKFLQNLNHSKHCSSTHDQVHFLYLALIHLENVEKELITSNLADELLYQEKIIDDIHSLKRMVLNYIQDLSKESNQYDRKPE